MAWWRHVRAPGVIALGMVLLSGAAGCSTGLSTDTLPSADAPGPTVSTAGPCREQPQGPTEVVYARRPGSQPEATSLDVYLPAGCGPAPVVVWIHGGGWAAGDKSGAGVGNKVRLANGLGAALVAVNYRLSAPGSEVMWPDHGDDVAAALAWVAADGPAIGLDPGSVTLLGHSAGAHLAVMAVADRALAVSAGLGEGAVRCVVALDTAAYDLTADSLVDPGLVAAAIGDDPGRREAASPMVQIRRHGAPESDIVVVTRGPVRRVAAARAFVDAVVDAGGFAQLLTVNASHQQVNVLLGADDDDQVTPVVEPVLRRCVSSGR
jgi:arylformamidase